MLKRPHVAVSPDSRLFVRDRGFEGLAFWRLEEDDTTAPLLVAELLSSPVASLGFSPRGALIAVTRDGELWCWDVSPLADWTPAEASDSEDAEPAKESPPEASKDAGPPEPELLYKVRLPLRSVVASAWSPDAKRLAIGDESGVIALVDLDLAEPVVARREAHQDQVVALTFSGNGSLLASSGRDRVARVWSTRLEEPAAEVAPEEPADLPDVPAEPDSPAIVTESEVLDFFNDSSDVEDVDAQPQAVEESPAPPDATSPPPGPTFSLLEELHGMEGWAVALAFDSTGSRLAAGAMDNGLYLFALKGEARLAAVMYVHLGWVADVEWAPDDSTLFTASWDTTVGVFASEDLTPEIAFEVHRDYVVDVTFIPNTPWVISASYDRTAVVWDWQRREAIAQLRGHSDWVDFAFALGDDRVVTICADGTSKVWSTESWTEVRALGVSASAGIEVGAAVDLSEYVDISGLASRALDRAASDVFQPVTRYRDMRSSSFSGGSGQNAISLLQSALEDAPGVEKFMANSSADASAEVDAAAAFNPDLPESVEMQAPEFASPSVEVAESVEPSMPEAPAFEAAPVDPTVREETPEVDVDAPAPSDAKLAPEEDIEGVLPAAPAFEAQPVDAPPEAAAEIDEDRAQTVDGVPRETDADVPEVDDAWESMDLDEVVDESTMRGRPPVSEEPTGPPQGAMSQGRDESAEERFEPRFVDALEEESAEDTPAGIGETSGTVGYHEDHESPVAPGATQPLHPVRGPSAGDTVDEVPRRQRAKTATGADLSEDSHFEFFFGPPGESQGDPDDSDEVEATSRLVPDRHFTGEFGSSPEVFDTSVSEIWTARPEKSEAKMGIVKKRNFDREFRSAFAIRTYHSWVYSVAIGPNGDSIASCGGNNLVCVWSKNGDLLHQLRAPSSGFNEVKFTPDGTVVVAAGDDGGIHLWMLPQQEYGRIRHAVLDGHDAVVSSIAFTPDGRYMLSGSFDGTARVWDLSDGRCRVVLEDHSGPIADVAIAGRRAYTVGHDGTVRIWDDRKWLAVDVFDGFDKLLGVSSNGVVHAWTAANGDAFVAEEGHPRGLLQHRGEARGVCVTESGMVVTAGQDAQIRIYQRGAVDPAQSLLAPASLWSLDVHDGFIAAGGDDGRIHIYRS